MSDRSKFVQQGNVWIGRAPLEWLDEAIRFLLPDERSEHDRQVAKTDHIFVALEQANIVGAIRGRNLAGSIAALWPPITSDRLSQDGIVQLVESLLSSLSAERLSALTQAVVQGRDSADALVLQSVGFRPIADLLFMLIPSKVARPLDQRLTLERFQSGHRPRLVAAVESTLENSQDCTLLDEVRTTEQIVDGYIADSAGNHDGWFFVKQRGNDVGCLLLSDRADDSLVEISYMGLAKHARGHGFGSSLVRFAISYAASATRNNVLAIVDEKNVKALASYKSCGAFRWDRRLLMTHGGDDF